MNRLKSLAFLILFFLVSMQATAQVNDLEVLIKVHPAAYFASCYNVGTEIGRRGGIFRLTFTAYRQTSFPIGFQETISQDEIDYEYDIAGVTYRTGIKYFFHRYLYLEGQYRYGTTAGEETGFSSPTNSTLDLKSRTRQVAALIGIQKRNANKTAMMDLYFGLGLCETIVDKTIRISANPQSVGTPIHREYRGLTGYIGFTMGLFLGKKQK